MSFPATIQKLVRLSRGKIALQLCERPSLVLEKSILRSVRLRPFSWKEIGDISIGSFFAQKGILFWVHSFQSWT